MINAMVARGSPCNGFRPQTAFTDLKGLPLPMRKLLEISKMLKIHCDYLALDCICLVVQNVVMQDSIPHGLHIEDGLLSE